MDCDFEKRIEADYELLLPRPVYSAEHINIAIEEGEVYGSKIFMENLGEGYFFAYVKAYGKGIRIEHQQVEGNKTDLAYEVDAKAYKLGEEIDGFLLFTYQGGEKKITIKGKIIQTTTHSNQWIEPNNKKLKAQLLPQKKTYQIVMNKKSYSTQEKARILIYNHEIYPITVKVIKKDKDLMVEDAFIAVEEMNHLDVHLKTSFFSKLRYGYYKRYFPIIEKHVTLEIHTELGYEHIECKLTFTKFKILQVDTKITSETEFKQSLIEIHKLYRSYLLNHEKHLINKTLVVLKQAIAYHMTDMNLKLFYILLLIDLDEVDEVNNQLIALSKYKHYYQELDSENYSELMTTLYSWLKGDDVSDIVKKWPMTPMKQLFRMHLFNPTRLTFHDFEKLYIEGIRSPFLYAEATVLLNEKPMVPLGSSKFYRSLLRWALTKNMLSDKWIDLIENRYYQVIQTEVLDSNLCYRLYTMRFSTNLKKLFCTTLIREKRIDSEAHAIYAAVLKDNIFIKDLMTYYIKSAFYNRLNIEVENLTLMTVYQNLTHDEMAYCLKQYSQKARPNDNYYGMYRRLYYDFLPTCMHGDMNKDESVLILKEIEYLLERQQWIELKALISNNGLKQLVIIDEKIIKDLLEHGIDGLDFIWLEHQLELKIIIRLISDEHYKVYVNLLLNQERFKDLMMLEQEGLLNRDDGQILIAILKRLREKNSEYAHDLAYRMNKVKINHPVVLKTIAETYEDCLGQMLDFLDQMQAIGVSSKAYMERVLYKGMITRLHHERVYEAYLNYRKMFYDEIVYEALDRYYAARILIEETYGTYRLIKVFEEDIYNCRHSFPIGLALLKLYDHYGKKNEVISNNLIKNAVKNGIIFPWFANLAIPYLETSRFRKGTFFSYNCRSKMDVTMHYRADGQETYQVLKMKHVAFGLFIGYIITFYLDHVDYYFVESSKDGKKDITESHQFVQSQFLEPQNEWNGFDVINTIKMSQIMKDDESLDKIVRHHIGIRKTIRDTMEIL
ncbi:DUF5717 family protein [Petrocella sp. FN5]|uniref:DUF5717 family protein n=1 Tax=Petrocella sp. FN5 TaxID=3032002 RepID=UPI0023DCA61F|nr:DUF5717 family protein [Petrocella sp. FN5]MDF1616659.1 DUF5717 family protein [Petrocella sp. FN5]